MQFIIWYVWNNDKSMQSIVHMISMINYSYELKNCKILYYQLVCILETAVYVSCLALISFHGLNQFYLDLFKETSLITVKVWNVDKFKFTIRISSYLFVSTRSNWNLALRQTLRNSLAASSGISGISRRSSILSLSPDLIERESSAISGLMLSDPSSISTTTKPPTWSEEIP